MGTGANGKTFSSRYIGSMVGDVHRTLCYGGVFGYPGDTKNPNGKLRLLYEGAPMSFIMEQAGGISTTGTKRVMEITPEVVHQRQNVPEKFRTHPMTADLVRTVQAVAHV